MNADNQTATVESETTTPAPAPTKEKAKAKAKSKKASASKKPKREMDDFGFSKGSKTSKVAAMYAKGGATTSDVKKAFGSPHLNLLKAAEKRGHEVKRETITTDSGRKVTRYTLTPKK